jgi:hypothetical protein
MLFYDPAQGNLNSRFEISISTRSFRFWFDFRSICPAILAD